MEQIQKLLYKLRKWRGELIDLNSRMKEGYARGAIRRSLHDLKIVENDLLEALNMISDDEINP